MKKSAKVAITGTVLFVGSLLLGVSGTVISMVRAFNNAAESGGASAQELSQGISNSLISTAIGIPIALLGLCLLVGGAIVYFAGGGKQDANEQSA